MFRSDFSEPMNFSKVAMSVEDQRALSQMEASAKLVYGYYQLGVVMEAQGSKPPEQSRICVRKVSLLKEKIPARPSPLREVQRHC